MRRVPADLGDMGGRGTSAEPIRIAASNERTLILFDE